MRTTGLQYICRASNPLEEDVSQKIVVTGTNKYYMIVLYLDGQQFLKDGLRYKEDCSHTYSKY
jgi:hypothetical protein